MVTLLEPTGSTRKPRTAIPMVRPAVASSTAYSKGEDEQDQKAESLVARLWRPRQGKRNAKCHEPVDKDRRYAHAPTGS